MNAMTIEALEDCRVAPFGSQVIKVKKGDKILADAANAEAWIDRKLFKAAKGDTKNVEPKVDNTEDATKKAESAKKKEK